MSTTHTNIIKPLSTFHLIQKIHMLPVELVSIIKEYALDPETHLEYLIDKYRNYHNNMLTLLENMSYHKLKTCYRNYIHRPIFQDPSLNTIERLEKSTNEPLPRHFFDILPKTIYMLSRTHMAEQPHPFYAHINDLKHEHNEMATEHQNHIRLARKISTIYRTMEGGNMFHEEMTGRMREIALGIFRGFIMLRWIH